MISILCPTRNRPDNVRRMVTSAFKMANDPAGLEFVFYLDEDDTVTEPELEKIDGELNLSIVIVRGKRVVLSQMWNECYKDATGPVFMHGGDDIEFTTGGWDSVVLDAFKASTDKILFVHGTDGIMPPSFGTHGFLHRDWVDVVGYFVPPYFSSDYNDTWLNDVADMIGRNLNVPIHTEHYHPTVGKAEWDQTHLDRVERHKADKVETIYADKFSERVSDGQKLLDYINAKKIS